MPTKPPSPDQTASPLGPVICHLYRVALGHGAFLGKPQSLMPLEIESHAKTDFQRGVLSCVASVYHCISQLPDGRKALCDLGLEPFFEYCERPPQQTESSLT